MKYKQEMQSVKEKIEKFILSARQRISEVWNGEFVSSVRQRIIEIWNSKFISSAGQRIVEIWNDKLKPEALRMYQELIQRLTKLEPKTLKILRAGAGLALVVILLGGLWLIAGDKFLGEKPAQQNSVLPAPPGAAQFAFILCGKYKDKPSIVECKYDSQLNAITLRTALNIDQSGARELCEAVVEQVREIFTSSENTQILEEISGMGLKIFTSYNREPLAICLF